MKTLAIWENWEEMTIPESLLVSLIAIVLVFLVLALLIFFAWLINAGMEKVIATTKILPMEENKILDEDPDAVAAVIAATIDFHKETGKNPEVKSITRIED